MLRQDRGDLAEERGEMKDSSTQGWSGVFLSMGSAQEALKTLGADSTAAPALPAKGCQLSAVVVVGGISAAPRTGWIPGSRAPLPLGSEFSLM